MVPAGEKAGMGCLIPRETDTHSLGEEVGDRQALWSGLTMTQRESSGTSLTPHVGEEAGPSQQLVLA